MVSRRLRAAGTGVRFGMAQETDAEEIVRLALVPVGAGKDLGDGGNLRVVARDAGAHDDAQGLGRVKVIVNDLHLALGHPVHAGDGVEREAFLVELLGGGDDLVGRDGRLAVIALERRNPRPETGAAGAPADWGRRRGAEAAGGRRGGGSRRSRGRGVPRRGTRLPAQARELGVGSASFIGQRRSFRLHHAASGVCR